MKIIYFLMSFICFNSLAIASVNINHDFINSSKSKDRIEVYLSKPEGVGKWPLLILLHPHQEWPNKIGGEVFVKNDTIEAWTKNNFVTVAVSLPGYGKSDDVSDFCGPITQNAVEDVIDYFKALSIVDRDKIFLYGGSRGAVVASLLATRHNYAGVVLKSGLYDFEEAYDSYAWYNSIKLSMIWELGFNNREKLKERSSILLAEKIKSPLLLIHGTEDSRASIEIAKKFIEKVKRAGTHVEFISLESEHFIPMAKIKPYMEEFFKKLK